MIFPDPDDLSPLRCAPRVTPLPYGLRWADLAPCLPGHDDTPGTALVTHTKQGLHGGDSSQILTLRYRDRSGRPRESVCFVKRDGPPRRGEAPRYRFLHDHGVPVASVLTTVEGADATVLVLEFLPVIGTRASEAEDLLALVATLNAVPDAPPALFAPQPGMAQTDFDALVERALPPEHRSRWLAAYRDARRRLERVPRALNHGELHAQQVGWSEARGRRRLVLFDLETTALLPRFTDVAGILDGLAGQTGRTDRELFEIYLRRLGRSSSHPADELWRELLTTRLVRDVESLPWLTERAGDPDLPESTAELISRIERDVSLLG